MFGVKHDPVAGFQLHFHGSELLGEVAGRSLQQSPCHVHSHLLPGTLGKGNACTQPASDIRHSFVERFLLHRGRDGQPLLPVRVEHGEFHRDDVASVLNRGHQYVEPLALHLCRPRHEGILRHDDMFPACMGSSSRSFTACPSASVWSWWMQAATVFFPIAYPVPTAVLKP